MFGLLEKLSMGAGNWMISAAVYISAILDHDLYNTWSSFLLSSSP